MSHRLGDPKQTLFLLDISSFIFRAFFAIRSLKNKKGEPTNAVYGVATMLARIAEEAKPEYMVVAYDSKEPSFREEIYPEYKANRSEPPDDLIPQFARIDQLVEAFEIHAYREPGVEADDLIATLTKKWIASDPKHQVVIVSNDKDLMQLVDGRVKIWDTMNDKVYTSKEVEEKWGVGPEKVRDLLGLMGDSSDNIPGVPGIGPKTAADLLNQHGDLDAVLKAAHDGKISGKRGEVLKAHAKDAKLSAELATVKEDVKLHLHKEDLKYHFHITPKCIDLLHELDFHKLIERWGGEKEAEKSKSESETLGESDLFRSVQTQADFDNLLKAMEKEKEFGFDLETTSLNPRLAKICGIAICCDPKFACYIPIGHKEGKQLPEKYVLESLKPYLENPKYKKVGQNLKYDFSVLLAHGIEADGIGADTMVASYVLEPEGRHSLQYLAEKYLDYKVVTYDQVTGKGKDQITFDQVPIPLATRYSAEDALIASRLWEKLKPMLHAEKLTEIFAKVDLPLVQVLTRMESEGVCIDVEWLHKLSRDFEKDLKRIEERVAAFTSEPINLNSPKQLGHLLFEVLKLPTQSKTKTGFSTDASVLEVLSPLHEVPRLLLEYREVAKLKGTYVDPLPELRDPKTGKIHASFHQTGTATGRLSSSDPNLQNIPIRSEKGMMIRRAFIPSPGNVLLSADYSQIELRILAHMSGDQELVKSFKKDEDVHRRTASEIFDVAPEKVDDRQRGIAKAINFGLMYGKTPFGLAQELKISRTEAKEIIDRYFERYSGVKKFLDRLIEDAREKGITTTLLGRRRYLPEIRSNNPAIRANAERMAMNTPIQGTAADLMKLAMIDIDERLRHGKHRSKLIVQVHDEVVLDCPKDEVERVQKLVVHSMEHAMELDVPLRVNSAFGANWMEL